MRKTPFYDRGIEAGANMVEAFGYCLPLEYAAGSKAEHLATRRAATICDLDYMGEFTVEGPDALRFIQSIATNDFLRKTVGSIQYTTLCDDSGLMVDDCTIWRTDANKYLIISGSEEDYRWISKRAAEFDVEITNITDNHTTLAIQGPSSKRIIQSLIDIDLSSLKFYRFTSAKLSGIECLIGRLGYTGEAGFEIHFKPDRGAEVWDLVIEAGKPYGILPCGQTALESLRQEAGYLLVGQDHDRSTNPFEAGIGFTVKMEKEHFIGKDALKKIAYDGVTRRMVWLDVPDGYVAKTGDKVLVSDKEIGVVTSGSFSPTRNSGTAMAYVAAGHAFPSLNVIIKSNSGMEVGAKLSVSPLYDPGNSRIHEFL